MSRNRHEQIKEMFLDACARPLDQRAEFLVQACCDDNELRREIESLLRHHHPDSHFLQPMIESLVGEVMASDQSSGFLSAQGDFAPGTVISRRYRVVGLLGRGGMGEVYRADDLTLGQAVALKFLPQHLTNDARWLERFHNEVRTARQIAHPNVCHVYDIGHADVPAIEADTVSPTQADKRVFLSMEFIDGENLASLLRRIGRLPKDKALQIARQLCAGLASAHQKGVLHRDLKPANVMIDGQGQVRMADFGLAVPINLEDGELSDKDICVGTPAYMAPEQLRGEQVSIQTDLYSIGLVLYELFTGHQAFKADSVLAYQRLHELTTPRKPSHFVEDIDPVIDRVILRCLEKEPRRRPESAMAIAAALPGGDPLSAALAAGETPSPEMVAAAGGQGLLPSAVALTLLASILLGMGAVMWLSEKVNLVNQVPLSKPPQVLADSARQIIYRLGYDEPPVDFAYGFAEDQSYLDAIEMLDEPTRWQQLSLGQPSAIYFWYRQNPKLLIPKDRKRRVSIYDPPRMDPGTITVLLDPNSRLVALWALPLASRESDVSIESWEMDTPELDRLFEDAGLDRSKLQSVAPTRVPPMFADEIKTWIGKYPSKSWFNVKVDQATFRGRVVHFSAAPQWPGQTTSILGSPSSGAATIIRGTHKKRVQVNEVVLKSLFVAALSFGSLLAWRNLQLGRGDRRGAFRVSMFIFIAGFLEIMLGATHVPRFLAELTLFGEACGYALFLAAQIWLFYMALEPFVRRIWPQTIISWTRLIGGRFRDPLVGRDILIGGAFAVWALVVRQIGYLVPLWFDRPPAQPWNEITDDLSRLLGSRFALAQFAQAQFTAIYYPLLFLLLLLLLRVLFRKEWLATAIFVLVIASPEFREPNWEFRWPIVIVLLTVMTILLTRFGMVSMIATIIFYALLTKFPLTMDTSAWYAPTGYCALGTAVALALFGFFMSRAGRPLLAEQVLDRKV